MPEEFDLYGLCVYYVVHNCDFGTVRVKHSKTVKRQEVHICCYTDWTDSEMSWLTYNCIAAIYMFHPMISLCLLDNKNPILSVHRILSTKRHIQNINS